MENNELRLGNWVYNDENKPVQVAHIETIPFSEWNGSDSSILFTEDGEFKYSKVNPIVISEQILEKSSLANYDRGYYHVGERIIISIDGNVYLVLDNGGQEYLCECQHVHTLQNLYFIVNGHEMDVTL